MWTFYYDVAAMTAPSQDSSFWQFALMTFFVGLIVLAPSYFENKNK
jgi:hypothetical protein